ncbi:MAG: GNAT family N-acetyltransferase [Candidatus Dormibacteria bacterium]
MTRLGHELELLGLRAWPAPEEEALGSWRLRFAGGVTRRANSVLALPPASAPGADSFDISESIAGVEAAYSRRGLPARFQVSDASWPPDLRRELQDRGYVESDRTVVMTAAVVTGGEGTGADWKVTRTGEPDRHWLDAWWAVDGRGGETEMGVASAILRGNALPRTFLAAADPAGTVGVGLAVRDGSWVGIYCMATLPRARRRGVARAILKSALSGAAAEGAVRAHLSVTEVNASAISLYGSAAFQRAHGYSYFTRDLVAKHSADQVSSTAQTL